MAPETLLPQEDKKVKAFKTKLANLFKARFPYIYITTWEEERVITFIEAIAAESALIKTQRKVYQWSLTTGLTCDGEAIGREETKTPLKALEAIEHITEPAVFVLKDFHIYFGQQGRVPEYPVIRKMRDLTTHLKHSQSPQNIVLLSPSLVLPVELQKDMYVLDMELPSFNEIFQLLNELITANEGSGRIQMELLPEDRERLAKAALGLTLQEAENAFAHAMVDDGKLSNEDVQLILEEKRQIIQKTGVLEYIKPDLNLNDVGGLQNLKRWLKKRDNSWLDAAKKYCLPAPKGVLITGVPGCGKSLIAKAISATWQLPLLRLDIGNIFTGLLGSSEENMRKAIQTAEAIAPSILWIDEIEKGFSGIGSQGDSGTATRVFGTFLTWMQEKTKPVFVIATANNIHALPPEMMRKGRFDEIFFVDLPTRRERMDIFVLHLKKRLKSPEVVGNFKLTPELLGQLADLSEGFIGAEIEQVVVSALFEAFSENRSIQFSDFVKVIETLVPLSVTQVEQILALRKWANVRAVSATPQEDRTEYANSQPVPEKPESPEDVAGSRGGRPVDF